MDSEPLAETRRVIVVDGLGVAKRLEKQACVECLAESARGWSWWDERGGGGKRLRSCTFCVIAPPSPPESSANQARHSLVVSVFPAPLSPEIMMECAWREMEGDVGGDNVKGGSGMIGGSDVSGSVNSDFGDFGDFGVAVGSVGCFS